MVGGCVAEGGIGIRPAPSQNGSAINDKVAGAREPHPEPSAHQQHEEELARRRSGGPQSLGLLRLARDAWQVVRSLRQPTGQGQRRPRTQPIVHLLRGQAPERAQQRHE